jgi:hypothetical protein
VIKFRDWGNTLVKIVILFFGSLIGGFIILAFLSGADEPNMTILRAEIAVYIIINYFLIKNDISILNYERGYLQVPSFWFLKKMIPLNSIVEYKLGIKEEKYIDVALLHITYQDSKQVTLEFTLEEDRQKMIDSIIEYQQLAIQHGETTDIMKIKSE